ncbi:MAG: 30S ribosomal protein S9 [Alphaproteobacteria bacterium]|nr:30S ribosomal protein S9 [Alphaproteobacteria bacterium]
MSTLIKEKIVVKDVVESEGAPKREQKIDSLGRSYASGKRKNAAARVWIKKGHGKITVNDREARVYFGREILINIVKAPFIAAKSADKFDVVATIVGGGLSGQAGALAHGISKALVAFDPNNHKVLRVGGFLTRDPRVVERKKYGFKKARKGQTYRKR